MRLRSLLPVTLAAALGAAALAQGGGPSTDASGDFEVSGVSVDIAAKTPDAARLGGWRLAQRKAWSQLNSRLGGSVGSLPDGTLDQIVSGIVVENEQIGPTRYIAKLGVLFNRQRASSILGISAYSDRSPPMLVIPIQYSGGVGTAFEQPTDWQAAWARFRTGGSTIDYVRPAGSGPDSMLLNAGQIGRPDRGWWRAIIDQYGAQDVLIPVVRLYRQWPGGPVIGVFEARYGPDNQLAGTATLRVSSASGLQQLLDVGVQRLDGLFQQALRGGLIAPDPSLLPMAAPAPSDEGDDDALSNDTSLDQVMADIQPNQAGIAVTIQYETPSASSVANVEQLVRAVPGVRSASTSSLALGGLSQMRVVFDGDPDELRTALEARGFTVQGTGQALRIRRAPSLPPPAVAPDATTTGG